MGERARVVHVVFSASGAGTLRGALSLLRKEEPVIGLADNLSVGPIDPRDPNARRIWAHATLRAGSISADALDHELSNWGRAWSEATAPDIHPVFWGGLTSPAEHACFLALAARLQERSFDIVEATNFAVTPADGGRRAWCLGMMRAQDVVSSGMDTRRRPVSPEEHRAASEAWSQLQHENAPFRIVRDGQLVSAPVTHYDARLVAQARPHWEIAPRLIGRMMTAFYAAPNGDETDDATLFARLLALGRAGALEIAGPGPTMGDYQVRTPIS